MLWWIWVLIALGAIVILFLIARAVRAYSNGSSLLESVIDAFTFGSVTESCDGGDSYDNIWD